MSNEKYNTKPRQKVLAAIKKQAKDFTAKSIYEDLNEEIGLTTIYRFIESLEAEGIILKVSQEYNTARYQYITPCEDTDHFYLKCKKCGKLVHVDDEIMSKIVQMIEDNYQFSLICKDSSLCGLCKDCR